MKVLVQIPCYNEERDIANVIKGIPREINGFSDIHVLIIDDGSGDSTVQKAIDAGADFIVSKNYRRGLADSFSLGQAFFMSQQYDVLVNTDGDNQYFQEKIPSLLAPIHAGKAEIVIGDRRPQKLKHFSRPKRALQWLGSRVVSFASRVEIPDAASGFRAYSRAAVAQIFITTHFSYAMESIIQAGNKNIKIMSIETGAKSVQRPSRLFRSNFEHIYRSSGAILKGILMYRSLQALSLASILLIGFGLIPMARYIVLVASNQAGNHLQSLILGSLLITTGVLAFVLGLVSDLSRVHRELFEREKALERLESSHSLAAILSFFSSRLIWGDPGR